MSDFSHLNQRGQAHMVDVSGKNETARSAIAECRVVLSAQVLGLIEQQAIAKGDLLATARIAGIQAAKQCSQLIPLCHPLPLTHVSVDIDPYTEADEEGLRVEARCETTGKTGVEMEALCAASVAGLTIYDMCKAIDKGFCLKEVRLLSKTGGKSGDWAARSNHQE